MKKGADFDICALLFIFAARKHASKCLCSKKILFLQRKRLIMDNGNLITAQELNSRLTPEERAANARKAGIASGEARRRNKSLREIAEALGGRKIKITLPEGEREETTYDVAMIHRQYQKAIVEGDTAAAKFIQNLRGEEQVAAVSTTIYNVPTDTAQQMQELENTDI